MTRPKPSLSAMTDAPQPQPVALQPAVGAVGPQAVLFDAYGTLFDVHSVALVAEQLFPGRGDALSQAWRGTQIDYTRLLTMSGRYQPFWEVTRAALRHAAARLGLALGDVAEDRLMNQYRHLAAFPDALDALSALQQRGVRAGVLSNGDPEMLAVAIRSAGLAALLNPVLSVHAVQRYKTDAAAYQLGVQALALPAARILFVSSNGWDALGASWFGYTTLWVNRHGAPAEELDGAPTHVASSLRAVAELLAC